MMKNLATKFSMTVSNTDTQTVITITKLSNGKQKTFKLKKTVDDLTPFEEFLSGVTDEQFEAMVK